MKKIEVLLWGIQHIAQNHGFASDVEYEETGEVCIYGGCNVPTLSDVRMLCEDLGMPMSCIENSAFGIEVYLDWAWLQENNEERDPSEGQWGLLLEDYTSTGNELWKRYGFVIGS